MRTWIVLLLVAAVGGPATQQKSEPSLDAEADFSKMVIEANAERLVRATRVPPEIQRAEKAAEDSRLDRSKIDIESPVESLVKTSRGIETQPKVVHPKNSATPVAISVKPGLVTWHKDYATAKAASEESGKPILLFQLLGNLGEHFT